VEAAHVPWRPLGELFVSRGLITDAELETALAEQAASGKRLGEILVDRGLVSGPDLTSTLMDQLGVEISKEEGFGSGLWAEIKRRHRRAHEVEGEGDEDDLAGELTLLPALEPEGEPETQDHEEDGNAQEPEPDPFAPLPAAVALQFDPVEPEPAAVDPELEHELDEIRVDYEAPAPIEPFSEPVEPASMPEPAFVWPRYEEAQDEEAQHEESQPGDDSYEGFPPEHVQFAEPDLDPESEPAPSVAVEPDPEPQPDPAAAAVEPALVSVEALVPFEPIQGPPNGHQDASEAELRAELEQARAELAQVHEMLVEAMTALAAFNELAAVDEPYPAP
jgi:hypothetical protein